LLVVLSSEARGYATAVLCALLGLLVFLDGDPMKNPRAAVLLGLVSTLGFLAHLVFVHFWVGAAAATAVRAAAAPRGKRVSAWLLANAPPLLVLGLLWIVDLSHLTVGGGPVKSRLDVLSTTSALAVGLPEESSLAVAALAAVLLCLVLALQQEWLEDRA